MHTMISMDVQAYNEIKVMNQYDTGPSILHTLTISRTNQSGTFQRKDEPGV
jgi:hypothetical protein